MRLKGKARKLAKESSTKGPAPNSNFPKKTVTYRISIKDLLNQARAVAGRVELPNSARRVLERAIRARRRCAEWFEVSKVNNGLSNEGHRYFIQVLEQPLRF
ncbi:hypothetical protein LZ554_003311 [Drepanopeziza brunnea f. sp. 'monogermtubi']|nr:hypothetical protein LZ554_003311 [Drepanopeziza brunnea f. sp. 'monogermtubi']